MSTRITIRFIGMDFWCRAVFLRTDREQYFKSVALMSHADFHSLPQEEKDNLLHTLHTTDEFEGEPGWFVPREAFALEE